MARRHALALPLLLGLCFLALQAPAASAVGPKLIATEATCAGQYATAAPAATQEQTMLCMVDFARQQYGEAPLQSSAELEASAHEKARDVLRCDEFSHYACGREFTYWFREDGFISPETCWRAGENLAWGTAEFGSVGSIFRAWMRSTTHRENILGNFELTGIDLVSGNLEGTPGTRVWAEHFGSRC
jgi:uncharacterized protein YkwD